MADPDFDDRDVSNVVLYDHLGNRIGVIDDPDDAAVQRLQVEADIKPGAEIIVRPATEVGDLFRQFLSDDGTPTGSTNMVINGQATPTVFFVGADPTNDIVLAEVRLLLSAQALAFDNASFGKGGGALPNGCLIEIVDDAVTTEIGNLTLNEEILMLPVRNDVLLDRASSDGVLALSIDFGNQVVLTAGSGDLVRVTIRDNLTGGNQGLHYFKFSAFGTKVTP